MVKVIEALEKCRAARRLCWGVLGAVFFVYALHAVAAVINAVASIC
nr:MAG TPA: hypothetical protein [Caudoviricetes sp.]